MLFYKKIMNQSIWAVLSFHSHRHYFPCINTHLVVNVTLTVCQGSVWVWLACNLPSTTAPAVYPREREGWSFSIYSLLKQKIKIQFCSFHAVGISIMSESDSCCIRPDTVYEKGMCIWNQTFSVGKKYYFQPQIEILLKLTMNYAILQFSDIT